MSRRTKDKQRPAIPVHLLDTNVILRHLIGDDSAKAARATALLERVDRGEEIVEIPDEVQTETVWTLQSYYQVPRSETARNLATILSFAGVRVTAPEVCLEALRTVTDAQRRPPKIALKGTAGHDPHPA